MSLALETLDESGDPPKTRIKDAKSAYAIFESLRDADRTAAANRDLVHRLLKGDPPFAQEDMDNAGMGWACNVNWLEAAADLEQALSQYVNLADSVPSLIQVKTSYGPEQARYEWENIIAEEYDWLLKKRWSSFYRNKQKTARWFIGDGLAINYWPHDTDWRSEVGRPGQFLFPSNADVDESKLEIVVQVEDYLPSRLYAMLQKEKRVKAAGDASYINRDAVIKAIRDAGKGDSNKVIGQDIGARFFGNALYEDYAQDQRITLVHYYVREFSGKVSHYIGRADGEGTDFLYQKNEAFSAMEDFFVFYTDGVGEGELASLQGIIWKAFPIYQAKNQTRCAVLDAAKLAAILWLKAQKSGTGSQQLADINIQSVTMLPEGVEAVQGMTLPNTGNNLLPILNEMSRLGSNNTGGYAQHEISPEGGGRTAREVSLQAANSALISGAKSGNYFQSETVFHRNTFKRLKNKDYNSRCPGYAEWKEWINRIQDRGVPLEAIWRVYEVNAVRPIGYGSPQVQAQAFGALNAKRGFMDPIGDRNLDRESLIVAGVDSDNIDRYFPPLNQSRTPVDARNAEFESAEFRAGVPVEVKPDDDHYIHPQVHVGFFAQTESLLQQGLMELQQAIRQMGPALDHVAAHLKLCVDPLRADVTKRLQVQLNEAVKAFGQMQAANQKQQADAAQVQQQQSAQGAQQLSPEAQAKLNAAQLEQQIKVESHQAEQARLDAETQARIARETAKTQQTLEAHSAKTAAQLGQQDLLHANKILPGSATATQPVEI